MEVLRVFGFADFTVELSTWDGGISEKYAGTPDEWELAEDSLFKALSKRDIEAKVMPDEAAFYGPKIDIKMVDAIGRSWQLSTIQFDFNLPRRFELEYVGPDGQTHQPVMVHRALWGSVERFFGVLIEHYAGAFPLWLAPVQATVLPITDHQIAYAEAVAEELRSGGLRIEVDRRSEKIGFKIREAQLQKVPYMLVVGQREAESGQVAVRHRRKGDTGTRTPAEFLADVLPLIESRAANA